MKLAEWAVDNNPGIELSQTTYDSEHPKAEHPKA